MVSTGLQNNQIFPTLLISLMVSVISMFYNIFRTFTSVDDRLLSTNERSIEMLIAILPAIPLLLFPLIVGLWGASLFKPGGTGAGFTASANNAAATMTKKES